MGETSIMCSNDIYRFQTEIVSMVQCSVIAVDLRGHGESRTEDEKNLSAETMSRDVGHIYEELYKDQETKPPPILIGHRYVQFPSLR